MDAYCVLDDHGGEYAEYNGYSACSYESNVATGDDLCGSFNGETADPGLMMTVEEDPEVAATATDWEELKFSWRYPLVYESMQRALGREDMLMTARRLLDECGTGTGTVQQEAMRFIELEGPLLR
jgi:hypothetical protein